MKLFIENRITSVSNKNEFLYGTGDFNVVWEKICSKVIQNDKGSFLENIPKPEWHHKSSANSCFASKTIIPDVLKLVHNDFFIFDAKYYKPIFENDKLKQGHPGVEDVSKQFLYELAFKDLTYTKYNIFIYPIYNDITKIDGKVTFNLFSGLDLCDIYLLQLNTNEIFQMYLDEKEFDEIFFDMIKKQVIF